VLFLCHAKLKDAEQAAVWKKLVENTLESPDTWEVALSAGKDKRENFQRLLREGKLGGMAVLREKGKEFCIATFSDACVELPPRRGFALRDAIVGSQAHSGTYLKRALETLREKREWRELARLIVITDEQSHDGILDAWTPRAYVVNVAPYKYGVSYGRGWTHVDGWSERIVDYIAAVEEEAAA
jgi:60 kDa SS-A/Ro ribonucleoprotein